MATHIWDGFRAWFLAPDRFDHEQVQFYGGYAFKYQSLYLAYVEVYHLHLQRIDVQLASSRDGIAWRRLCDREVFLPNGRHGEMDAYWIVPTFNAPILKDGQLLIHYNGRSVPHSQPGFTFVPPGMDGSFSLATLREDGFVSLDATGTPGTLRTKVMEIEWPGRALEINCCPFNGKAGASPMSARLVVEDESGQAVAAYQVTAPPESSQVWHRIELDTGLPRRFRLAFTLQNTRLYSFRII